MAVGRFWSFILGTGLAGTDDGDGEITINVTGAPPTGTAGGDLVGTYPNPDVAIVDSPVLGSGSATSATFLRGDRTWQTIVIPAPPEPADDEVVWMPLTSKSANTYAWVPLYDDDGTIILDSSGDIIPTRINFLGVSENVLVYDEDDSLVPTLVPA